MSLFNNQFDKAEMLKVLKVLGNKLKSNGIRYEIYLFGSCLGMYLLDKKYRMSLDVDYQSKDEINSEEIKDYMNLLNIHEIGGIMNVPPLEELVIVDEFVYGYLTVKIPSIENFALSKLLSDRQKDYNDLKSYPILDSCDINKLKGMLNEYLEYFVFKDNPNYNFNFLEELLEERNLKT